MYSIFGGVGLALAGTLIWAVARRQEPVFGAVVLITVICGFCGFMAGLVVESALPMTSVLKHRDEIVAMTTHDSVQGSFFLGFGDVNGTPEYTVYVQKDSGVFTPYQVPANNSTIIVEDPNLHGTGVLKVFKVQHESSGFAIRTHSDDHTRYELDVPVGTIVKGFSAS